MAKQGYVGIGDTAHKIKSMYVGVNGVAHKVKSAYVGVNGIARQWYASGTPIGSLNVGFIVKIKVDNVLTDFLVVNQGIPQNSSLYDASCDGTWLLMKDIYNDQVWSSGDVNKYESSDIHSYLSNTFINLFDSSIRDAVKQAKIPYRQNGGLSGTDQSGANGLSCKVFLLSGYEVGWTNSDNEYFPVDGAKLDYFETGGTDSANNKRIAKYNGKTDAWWLRSPDTGSDDRVWVPSKYGSTSYSRARNSYGIRPAFILPKDTLINPETMEIVV